MAPIPTLTLNDGRSIPQIGYGCWQIAEDHAPDLVGQAIKAGYRLIDTAAAYGNEVGCGRGIKESGVPRDQIFLTTKIWNDRQGRTPPRPSRRASRSSASITWIST